MARGTLRVYLGAAPGVGKTYRMLDEGWRRRERGTDVVVGYVETHGRALTEAQIRDLEVVPRVVREYRGAYLEEMDLAAILARQPAVVLVDELAHSNAPGGVHDKRWRDVAAILDSGIDVITTVNIQHLESVNDVVVKITGVLQNETVPDVIVRGAEQIELVDLTPEALRRRMAHGNIYAADKIDASLSNFFRVGNLSALRELALLWLADRVDDALQRYLEVHEIDGTWETRERLVVGVAGSSHDETLLRRAARVASRSGAQIIAVHVEGADEGVARSADTTMARQLSDEFEGRFVDLVDDNVANALLEFARRERATQIVVGSGKSRSLRRPLGGVVERVLAGAKDLDVHVIAAGAEPVARTRRVRSARVGSWRRTLVATTYVAVALASLTWLMSAYRSSLSLSSEFVVYLAVVLVASARAGVRVGVASALAAFALENYYFVAPLHTLEVARADELVSLGAFVFFAAAVAVVVATLSRRRAQAERALGEARLLSSVLAASGSQYRDVAPVLDAVRAVFHATSVTLVTVPEGERPVVDDSTGDLLFDVDDGVAMSIRGATLRGADRQLAADVAARVGELRRAKKDESHAASLRDPRGTGSRLARALRGFADDLGGPLSGMERTLSALADGASTAPAAVQRERLALVGFHVQRLRQWRDNLVDLSRLAAGEVHPRWEPVRVGELVRDVARGVRSSGTNLDVDVADDLPVIVSDPRLLSRALDIVVTNALRFTPPRRAVRVIVGATPTSVEILVIDAGPGMDARRQSLVAEGSFDRLEGDDGVHVGLGVAVGFTRLLGGQWRFEDTPAGGLTVVVDLPLDEATPPVSDFDA